MEKELDNDATNPGSIGGPVVVVVVGTGGVFLVRSGDVRVLKLEGREGRGIGRPGRVFISVCGDGRYEVTPDNAVTLSSPPGVIDINVPCGDDVSTSLCWAMPPEVVARLNKRLSIVREVGDITDSSPF